MCPRRAPRRVASSLPLLVLLVLASITNGTCSSVFGLLNSNYTCTTFDDDERAGVCNEWMRNRICDIGFGGRRGFPGDLISSLSAPPKEKSSINFGVVTPLSGPEAAGVVSSHFGLFCALEQLNREKSPFEYDAVFGDSLALQSGGTAAALCFQSQDDPYSVLQSSMLLGPAFSSAAVGAGTVGKIFGMPILATTASSADLASRDATSGFPTLSRVMPSDENQGKALAQLVHHFDWNQVVTLQLENDVYTNGIVRSFSSNCNQYNVTVVKNIKYSSSNLQLSVERSLNFIKAINARVILLVGYTEDTTVVLDIARRMGLFGEGYAWVGSDSWVLNPLLSGPEETALGVGVMGLTPHVDQSSAAWEYLTECFQENSGMEDGMFGNFSYPPDTPDWSSAFMYDAVHVGARAIKALHEAHPDEDLNDNIAIRSYSDELIQHIRKVSFPGATGYVNFTQDGERVPLGYDIVNVRGSGLIKVGTINFTSGTVDMDQTQSEQVVFPGGKLTIPQIETMSCQVAGLPDSADVFGRVLVTLGTLLVTICIVFNVVWRNNKIVRVSSWRVNIITIFGCFLVYLALHQFAKIAYERIDSCAEIGSPVLDAELSAKPLDQCTVEIAECTTRGGMYVCAERIWLFGLGYSIAFGSLFAKTYRITQLFSANGTTKKIGDKEVAGYVLAQMLPMLIILVVWTAVYPFEVRYRLVKEEPWEKTPFQQSHVLEEYCSGDHFSTMLLLFVFYCFVMLVLGAFLAWGVKNVWIKEVNDSSQVAMCIYTLLIVGGLGYAICSVLDDSTTIYFATVSVGWFCNTAVLIILFAPKMLEVYRRRHEDEIKLGTVRQRVGVHEVDDYAATAEAGNKLGKKFGGIRNRATGGGAGGFFSAYNDRIAIRRRGLFKGKRKPPSSNTTGFTPGRASRASAEFRSSREFDNPRFSQEVGFQGEEVMIGSGDDAISALSYPFIGTIHESELEIEEAEPEDSVP